MIDINSFMCYNAGMTKAYVYKWTHLPTLKWYIGSRIRKGCHPNDGYICSSKYVKPLIESNPTEWMREIIAVGEPADIRNFESVILNALDAARDPQSLNRHNGGSKFMNIGNPWNKGIKTGPNPDHSQRMKGRASWNKGIKGGTSWNKGITGEQHHNFGKKYNMEKTTKHNDEFKERQRQRGFTNNPMKLKLNCPHCDYVGPKSRWHWDNCRHIK